MTHKNDYRIGDVYMVEFYGCGCEQQGVRPAVIFQNNVGNKYSPNVIALPMTSVMKKLGQPTHVLIRASESGLDRDSLVLCENPERVCKLRIGEYITHLSHEHMKKIAIASVLASSAISFIDERTLLAVKSKADRLNFLKN